MNDMHRSDHSPCAAHFSAFWTRLGRARRRRPEALGVRHRPRGPRCPRCKNRSWARNPIDRIHPGSAREQDRQTHAPGADRATLLRRLSFDLTGLPPSPREQRTFLADTSPEAYDRLVDRLLASPQLRRALGAALARPGAFAETDGFEFDQARPDAWRYRDWVVEALNRDLPYDVFVRLQLAGDEVRPDDPGAFIATGFNRCYPDMVDLNDQGLRRQNALDDITETTGLVFLGLTIGCARCHDHKFDPIRADRLLPASGILRRCTLPRRLSARKAGATARVLRCSLGLGARACRSPLCA